MSQTADDLTPEWSHILVCDSLKEGAQTLNLVPDGDVMEALARRMGVLRFDEITAVLTVHLAHGGEKVHIKGVVDAVVVQACVVSAEPLSSEVREEFDGWFAGEGHVVSLAKARNQKMMEDGRADVPVLDEEDDPEPIVDGQIDVGELCAQYLSLGLNPYPQAEGAVYDGPVVQDKEALAFKNPFAALADWKDKLMSEDEG